MNISLGIIFGLIAMFAYGLSNGIAQSPIKKIGSLKTVFYRNIFASILLFPVLIFFLKDSFFSPTYILVAIGLSLLGYFPLLFFYKALKIGKVGIISPIANSSVIFTILFSIIIFGEKLSISQIISIIFIIAGIVLISINFRDFKKSNIFTASSGVPFALLTCILWGLVFFLWKYPVNILGPILTAFIIETGVIAFSATNIAISKETFKVSDKKALLEVFFLALLGAIGTIFYTVGIKNFPVSIIAAITFASPLIAVLYGKFIYKEKLLASQWAAVFLILAGITTIYLL